MAVNIGLDASFDNIQDLKGIRKKAGEVNSTKAYTEMIRFPVEASTGVTLVLNEN
jgi:hypothetical protein